MKEVEKEGKEDGISKGDNEGPIRKKHGETKKELKSHTNNTDEMK